MRIAVLLSKFWRADADGVCIVYLDSWIDQPETVETSHAARSRR
jgi:hypothetical protein